MALALKTKVRALYVYRSRRWMASMAVCAASALFVALIVLMTPLMTTGTIWFHLPYDHRKYYFMAQGHIGLFHIAPFCWRIGLPALVSLLPFDTQAGFLLISALSVWATGVLVYAIARAMGLPVKWSWLGIVLYFSLAWATKIVIWDFWLPDALCMAIITALIWCIVTRRPLAYVVLLAVGVAAKETTLFVVPLWYTLQARRWLDRRLAVQTVLYALPAVAVLAAIRIAIPAWNDVPAYHAILPRALTYVQPGTDSYNYIQLLRLIGLPRLESLTPDALRVYSIGTFGMALPVAALLFGPARLLFLRYVPFLILIYSQLLVAENIERLVIFGFPALLFPSIVGLSHWADRWRIPTAVVFALPCVMLPLTILTVRPIVNTGDLVAPLTEQLLLVKIWAWGAALFTSYRVLNEKISPYRRRMTTMRTLTRRGDS